MRVLYNGIDLTRFDAARRPRAAGRSSRSPASARKRILRTLLHAAALAAREDDAFRLEIAGDGPCMADLRRTAAELGLDGRVRFHGQVRDVPALLARAGLFVLPSLTEGVSLTLLEAMACGLAVVATRVGGNPEVVADGETGLLAPPGDPAALAAAILRLRRDDLERRRMERAGRRRVERCFDVRRMTAEYEKMYLGLDGRAARSRAGGTARPVLTAVDALPYAMLIFVSGAKSDAVDRQGILPRGTTGFAENARSCPTRRRTRRRRREGRIGTSNANSLSRRPPGQGRNRRPLTAPRGMGRRQGQADSPLPAPAMKRRPGGTDARYLRRQTLGRKAIQTPPWTSP